MPVLDLTNHLDSVKNRIAKVGVELEGGWAMPLPLALDNRIVGDGSVFTRGQGLGGGRREHVLPEGMPPHGRGSYIGEAPSRPLDPSAFPKWIRNCYPKWVDDTCGLHVHMSFINAKYYEILASSIDYQDTLLNYLKQWAAGEEAKTPGTFPEAHHIWARLTGQNRFCLLDFWPEKQIMKSTKVYDHERVGHRYTALNFCYGLHKTVECRVLPMMTDADMAVRAVRSVIDITNACLVVMAQKTMPVVEEVFMLPDNLYEEVDQELI